MGNKPVLSSRVLSIQGGFLIAVWVAYLLSFFLLYRWLGSFATILAVIPVIVSSWLLGFWAGALVGLVTFLLDMFLLYWVRSPDLRELLGVPGVPIAIVMITVGAAVGRLSDVSDQLELQLANRKRVEEALREAEAKYRTLVEQVPAAIYMDALDEVSSPIYFSPQVEAMLGYSPEEWRADPELWVKLLHPDDRQRILAENTRTNATGEPFKVEYRLIARDGRTVWVRDDAVLVRDEAGHPQYWQGVLFDITAWKQMDSERERLLSEVRQSEQLMRSLIDATPDWIFIKDREHRYRLANQGYANALHIQPQDFIGKDDLELGFPEELVKGNPEKGIRGFWADDQLVMDTGETQVYPNDPATIDGVVHTFHTIKTPLRDADGQIWGVLAFARDVTDREQLAHDIQARAQRDQLINTMMTRVRAGFTVEQVLAATVQEIGVGLGAARVAMQLKPAQESPSRGN